MTTTTAQSTTPTTEGDWQSNVPVYKIGSLVDPSYPRGGRVARIELTPGGSQTIHLDECPTWCAGHNPDEQVERIEEYDWSLHTTHRDGIYLPGLADCAGVTYRDGAGIVLDVEQVVPLGRLGWRMPMVSISTRSAGLTPSEVRTLAAALVRLADDLETHD